MRFLPFRISLFAVTILLVFASCSVTRRGVHTRGTTGDPYSEYVSKYSELAVRHMKKYGIPASITLAQGLLESDAGRSSLAKECNNHFGIKCHSDWQGRTMLSDDDRRNECFRCYSSAADSFEDHSLFLVNGSRYRNLFSLGSKDYKGWARGLKAAGYATNPNYADKLIGLIERYGLDRYDERSSRKLAKGVIPHRQFEVNGVRCVQLGEGETLRDIAREFSMSLSLLRRFNDVNRSFVPPAGSLVYLERKKSRAPKEQGTYTVKSGDSLWSISQKFGIKMDNLAGRNRITSSNPVTVGMTLRLR
ncbi:MAG: glucosaminidase domain-containing protein [Bacteroidaceae bacterium]|nr:glucosaminidase domain-containing protein [Bacteroidaceae bacterium]